MKILFYSARSYDQKHFEAANPGTVTFEYMEEALSLETAHYAEGAFAVCIFVNDDACAAVLEKLAMYGVKGIAIRAAGHDQTDHEAAHRLGMRVANVPAYSPHAIAEHTVTMILALTRHIVEADSRVKQGNFILDPLVGFNIHHKTVGIIGLGKIGGLTAKILHGFGCTLQAFDPYPNQTYTNEYGLQYKTIEAVLTTSDIIVIHAPLNADTKYLINAESIKTMKDGVMIVNTGRGGIINTKDVLDGLTSGKIGYLGLDVYENEKGLFFSDHSANKPADEIFLALTKFKNVLITGHMAFLTTNALASIAKTTVENLGAWRAGKDSDHEIR